MVDEFRSEYSRYIGSKEWKEKREYFFNLLGRVCFHCGSHNGIKNYLVVHHLTYIRFADILPRLKFVGF